MNFDSSAESDEKALNSFGVQPQLELFEQCCVLICDEKLATVIAITIQPHSIHGFVGDDVSLL